MRHSIADTYDRAATRYRDLWGPVIAPAALRLLDRAAPLLGTGEGRMVDIGTGIGVLALAALDRWPALRVVGVDPSTGMRALALERATAAGVADRLLLVPGEAQSIPMPNASCDLAVSSFVLQLVPDRTAALREARRVLRPGAWLAVVTWIEHDTQFAPLTLFDELADELELPEDASAYETDPFASVESAADELRDAGFSDVAAVPDVVEHAFTPDAYLALLEGWERDDVFEPLSALERERVRGKLRLRWADLPASAFVWRAPVVSLLGRRASR